MRTGRGYFGGTCTCTADEECETCAMKRLKKPADLGMLYTLLIDGTFERVRADDREWVAHDGEALVIVRLVVVPDEKGEGS